MTLEYKLLGLLSRQPMSGYDITNLLKQRFVPFGQISHTQIYPALASLGEKGLVRFHIVDQQAVRPSKKVYELTDAGRDALRQWVESPTPLGISYGDFFLKAFNLWLADPERMVERFREQAQLHQEQLEFYERELQSDQFLSSSETKDKSEALKDILFQYVIGYERNYLTWCQDVIRYLEQQGNQEDGEERQAGAE